MNTPFVFFGTSRISVILLEELKSNFGIIPSLIITAPSRPAGRKQEMTPPPAKIWADQNDIPALQPEKLNEESLIKVLKDYKLFIVASYGKIIPQIILDIPEYGTLNVHPSLLPKYRGPAPIQGQILNNEKEVGATIMLMDALMDHGPILAQKKIDFGETQFPAPYDDVEETLAMESAALLAETLPRWLKKKIVPQEQDHDLATYTKMLEKSDGEISLADDGRKNYLKYLAYQHWPKVFFFFKKGDQRFRAIVTKARYADGKFVVERVIPEGKKETDYEPAD